MTISMLVRRAAAIGAAVIAVSGVIAGPALASAPRAPAPRHVLERQGMYVAGFDAAVAKAHGYKIVTYANGDMQAVPINPRSGLPKGTLLVKASAPKGTIRPDDSGYSKEYGDCGDSWIYGYQIGAHKIDLESGFDVVLPAVKYRWTILLTDFNGDSEQGDSGWLAEDSSWSGEWNDLTQYEWTNDQVENSSYAELTDGEICFSTGPMITFNTN
ncbi:MAG: hypothetical protein JO345_30325 [Streptosporangiaceae bacterium]|nr:hypothetical protein [Streptosporangiaceae bacterium]